MAIIDPDGLFNGDRLRRCSNQARLYWPYFFLASNGYGRLEINYHRIVARAFSTFDPVPSETDIMCYLKEYQEAHLLFLYNYDGQIWGQWDCPDKLLKKFKTAADKSSPNPPEELLKNWKNSYQIQKKEVSCISENIPELFGKIPEIIREELPLGVGVGVGEGKGKIAESPVFNAQEAAMYVKFELGLTGQYIIRDSAEAIESLHQKQNLSYQVAAESLVRRFKNFQASGGKKGFGTFIHDGDYLNTPDPGVKPKRQWRVIGNG